MATKVKKEVEISAKDLASKTLESLSYKFKKFEGAIKSVQSAAGNVARSARGIVTLFGGVATAGVAAINKMANQMDNLQTMANVVGMNVEAYQKLRYAAEQNDVSTEGFDKSVKMLSKSMGELRAGTGSLYTKLKRTNPALLKQLRGAKDNESAFRLMMEAINKAPSAQKKAYLAVAAFGKSGQELISLANAGADAMAEWEKEAESFGLVSEDGGKAADEWGRAVVRVRKALEGVGYTVMNEVLPALIPTVNEIAKWIIENRELIKDRVIEWGKKFYNVLKSIAAIMSPLIQLFSEYSWLVYALFIGKSAGLVLSIIKLGSALLNLCKVIGLFNVALWTSPITWIIVGIAALVAIVIWLWKNWSKVVEWFQKMCDKYPALKKLFDYLKKAGEAIVDVFKGFWKVISKIIDGFKWVWDKFSGWFGGNKTVTVEQKTSADNWIAENITQPKYSPNMSPIPAVATMGGMSQSADINVRFDNLPPMTRIETVTNDTDLDLEIYRGTNGGTIQ